MRKALNLVAALMLAAGVLVAGGILSLRAGWWNDALGRYGQEALSSALGMPVTIGAVLGNPLGDVQLLEVQIGVGEDELLYVERLEAQYGLFSLVWGQEAVVERLRLVSVRARYTEAAKADSVLEAPSDLVPGWTNGLAYRIRLERVEVVDGSVLLRFPGFEDQVDQINLELGLEVGPDGYRVALRGFQSMLFDPPVVVTDLTGVSLLRDGRLTVSDLRLNTQASQIHLDGEVRGISSPEFEFNVRADSIALEEIKRFVPGFYFQGKLGMKGKVWGDAQGLKAEAELGYLEASYRIAGEVNLSGEQPVYDFRLEARNLDLAPLLPEDEVDIRGNLTAHVKGTGVGFQTARATLVAGISESQLFGVAVDTGDVTVKLDLRQAVATVRLRGQAGQVRARMEGDVGEERPLYDIVVDLTHLDLSKLPGGSELPSDLTGRLHVRRTGDEAWVGDARFQEPEAGGYRAQFLALRGAFREGQVRLDHLEMELPSQGGVLNASGRMDLGKFWRPGGKKPAYRLALDYANPNLALLTSEARLAGPLSVHAVVDGQGVQLDSVQARIELVVEAPELLGTGLDSARATLVQEGRQLRVEDVVLAHSLASLHGAGRAVLPDSLDVQLEGLIPDPGRLGDMFDVALAGKPVSVTARLRGTWDAPRFYVDLQADSLVYQEIPATEVRVQARWPVLASGGFSLRIGSIAWGTRTVRDVVLDAGLSDKEAVFLLTTSEDDPDRVYLWGRLVEDEDKYRLSLDSLSVQVGKVTLVNDGPGTLDYDPQRGLRSAHMRLSGPAGHIEAWDEVGKGDPVRVWLEDVDLRLWGFLLGLEDDLGGILNGQVDLGGTVEDPRIAARLNILKGRVGGFHFQRLNGKLGYSTKRLEADLTLAQEEDRYIALKGSLPFDPFAGSTGRMFPQETMDLSLKSEGINLEFLELLTSQVKRTSGVLALDMQVSGTPDRPEHKGWIRLTDGDFYLVPLGQRFGKIQAYVTFSEDRVALESFRVGDKKERLSASGQVLLDRFEVREFDLSVKARELEAVNWPELKATLQADLRLTGDLKAPRLDGNAELTRAVVQLYSFVESPSDSFWTTSEFWKNLDGRVRVSTPRNVWIRDRDINVELEGDIDLVKDRQGLRIYGSLNSRQGRYEFLNTTFRIERAEIQFLGNVDINPDLYVLGTHPLRLISRQAGEPGEEAVISVIVGGSLLKPQVTLESDPFLSEADILSYLTIGRPAGGAIGGEGGGFGLEGQAAGLVMGVAASQLKRTIGAQLNLDVVEVDMGEGASLTRVRVGKYIGSRLFITYSQELSSAGGQEVTVEYELLPHVTLEAQQRVGSEQQRDRQSLGIFWKKDW